LFRLYNIDSGEIKFLGDNVEDLYIDELRKQIVVIPKDYLIMEGTIKSNIDMEGLYSKGYLEEILAVFVEIFVKPEFSMFNDLNNKVSYGGNNLSEGQKTLILILRGILRKPNLLCFDESNAELDDYTERLLFKILYEKFNMTLLVIAHKLNILDNFDIIIVIEDGRIKDIDKPSNILIN
jgi:ATP-binding cassette subfamily C (CFTR/MRP) protein 1